MRAFHHTHPLARSIVLPSPPCKKQLRLSLSKKLHGIVADSIADTHNTNINDATKITVMCQRGPGAISPWSHTGGFFHSNEIAFLKITLLFPLVSLYQVCSRWFLFVCGRQQDLPLKKLCLPASGAPSMQISCTFYCVNYTIQNLTQQPYFCFYGVSWIVESLSAILPVDLR